VSDDKEHRDSSTEEWDTLAGAEGDGGGDGADRQEGGEHRLPGPATWAGRQRAADQAPPADEEEPDEGEPQAEAEESQPVETAEPQAEAQEPEGEGDAAEAQEAEQRETDEPEPAEAEAEGVEEPAAEVAPVPDREHATDAALAGLRARAGTEAAAEGAAPAAPAATAAAGTEGDGKIPRAKPMWPRFLAASLVIVISMATATAVSALVFLADFAEGLGGIPGVSGQLSAVEGGDPQTILILGSDKRPTDETGRSDTTMLLRVDPARDAIALLSIPRDLKVNIPGVGVDKFNYAYAVGGPKKTLETAKALTGLDIHHVVNINFTGFADAVDAIDCVYIDVDRQYYVSEGSVYSAIDPPIGAGYQRLCGLKALQYVRYRLEDTDLVRSARQQDFLREARQKIEPAKLAFNPGYREKLLDIFKEYTTSDERLEDPIEVLALMKTFLAARNAVVTEVHFPAQLGEADSPYVTASEEAIQEAVDQFLGAEGTPGPREGGEAEQPEDEGGAEKPSGRKEPEPDPEPAEDGPPMIDVAASAEEYARQIAAARKDRKPLIDFPIRYPTRLVPGSGLNAVAPDPNVPAEEGFYSRAFPIDGPGKDVYAGYKYVSSLTGRNSFTEYYGVSGTNWEDPPILENPSEEREIDGKEYLLYYDGDRLRLIGWKTNTGSYWVINTLTQTLEASEMLAIATSMRKLGG
jgi:LCP family protein required for cell wall assembly